MGDYANKVLRDMAKAQLREPSISVIDFRAGDRVRFVPTHAYGDVSHPDCQDGVVTSINDKYVFVRFNPRSGSGEACDPQDLVKR